MIYFFLTTNPKMANSLFSGSFVRGISWFGVGYFLAIIYEKVKIPENSNKILITALEVLSFCFMWIKNDYLILKCISFSALFYLSLNGSGYVTAFFNRQKWCNFLGRASYSVYVMQGIPFAIWHYTKPDIKVIEQYPIFFVSSVTIFSTLFGVVVYYFFERPIGNWLKKKGL
jgi:peptidoglycan/LPS O-acetylase OafA/YrhL